MDGYMLLSKTIKSPTVKTTTTKIVWVKNKNKETPKKQNFRKFEKQIGGWWYKKIQRGKKNKKSEKKKTDTEIEKERKIAEPKVIAGILKQDKKQQKKARLNGMLVRQYEACSYFSEVFQEMKSYFLDFKHPSTAKGQMVNIMRFDLISFFFSMGEFWGEAFCERTVMIHLCTLFCEQHVVLKVSSSPDKTVTF